MPVSLDAGLMEDVAVVLSHGARRYHCAAISLLLSCCAKRYQAPVYGTALTPLALSASRLVIRSRVFAPASLIALRSDPSYIRAFGSPLTTSVPTGDWPRPDRLRIDIPVEGFHAEVLQKAQARGFDGRSIVFYGIIEAGTPCIWSSSPLLGSSVPLSLRLRMSQIPLPCCMLSRSCGLPSK